MSQIIKSLASGPVPPAVPTSFQTDSGVAVPAANVLNILTSDVTDNFDNGIHDTGSGNTVTISLTNRATGTVTTTDDTITTVITLPMGATPACLYVYGNVQAFNSSNPAAGGYSFSGAFITDGITATELGSDFQDQFESLILEDADILLIASGNNIVLQVEGLPATTINWNSLMEYRVVT